MFVVIILLNNFEPSRFEVHEIGVPYQGLPSREDIEELEKSIASLDEQVTAANGRINQLSEEFLKINEKFDQIDSRIDNFDQKFVEITDQLSKLKIQMHEIFFDLNMKLQKIIGFGTCI
jgi:chromosome segregation ATPase